jgi:hypothetical protein
VVFLHGFSGISPFGFITTAACPSKTFVPIYLSHSLKDLRGALICEVNEEALDSGIQGHHCADVEKGQKISFPFPHLPYLSYCCSMVIGCVALRD